jgi:hypothetical protein
MDSSWTITTFSSIIMVIVSTLDIYFSLIFILRKYLQSEAFAKLSHKPLLSS